MVFLGVVPVYVRRVRQFPAALQLGAPEWLSPAEHGQLPNLFSGRVIMLTVFFIPGGAASRLDLLPAAGHG